jgi:DNA-binding LacI/PurR family transcriptional regulator
MRGQGMRLPADMSVAGFDDDALCAYLDPALSTIRQPSSELGEAAMELLTQRMTDPRGPVEHRILPTRWVPRASVAGVAGR